MISKAFVVILVISYFLNFFVTISLFVRFNFFNICHLPIIDVSIQRFSIMSILNKRTYHSFFFKVLGVLGKLIC